MEFIEKLIKILTSDDRIIFGYVQSLDYLGNIYLEKAVEVFNKEEGYYSNFEIFKGEATYFETKNNQYQIMGDVCIKTSNIKSVFIQE